MKNRISELEEQLSRSVLEEQLLRSENVMLVKELDRLKRVKEKNNEYKNGEIREACLEKRKEMARRHSKNMKNLNEKVWNCKQTIEKLRELIDSEAN